MSDTKLPVDQRNEGREHLSPRGHPQQHQGHKPNQEQVGGARIAFVNRLAMSNVMAPNLSSKKPLKGYMKSLIKTTLHW